MANLWSGYHRCRVSVVPGSLTGRRSGARRGARGSGVGVMVGWLIAAVLVYCVFRSPGTVLLLVALVAAAIS